MKVFIFDLLAYGENLEHLRTGLELPYPLSNKHFKADVAVRTYAEHLAAWEEMDELGYDGIGFNEPCLSGCNPHPLYVGCAVIRQARVSEWKLMF